MSFMVPLFDPLHPQYFVKLLSDRWLQSEHTIPINFRSLVLPDKFASPTALTHEEARVPLVKLEFDEAQKLYLKDGVKMFSAIQSQCFDCLYNTSDDAFIGIPMGGTESRTLAELVIFREILKEDFNQVIYIGASHEKCKSMHA